MYAMEAPQTPFSPDTAGQPLTEATHLSVMAERLQVGKEVVETGRVRVFKKVHESIETIDLPVLREEYDIERIPVNTYLAQPPEAMRYEGDTLIIPVLQEVVVTETRLLLVEEIRLTKRQVETRLHQEIPLRREEIVVERQDQTSDSDLSSSNSSTSTLS